MSFILFSLFTTVISGKVFNIESNEPLLAHIYLENLNQITICDSNGKFLFHQIPHGKYNFIISHIGFKEESLKVEIAEDGTTYLNIGLQPRPIAIEPVEVKEKKPPSLGTQIITQEEIQIIPGAEKDIFRVIQTLPGVSTPTDYLGLIYVRGGELYENQVIFDGAEILSPYHYFGVGSAFNTDVIENFEFYSGTFPARYGGAISSVLNIKSKVPDEGIKGNLSIDLIEADWLYSCPINKNASFVFSSKRNYLDLLLKNMGIVKDVILPYYIDHQGKILIETKTGIFTLCGLKSVEQTDIEASFANETIKLVIEGNGNSIATGWQKGFTDNIIVNSVFFYTDMNRYLHGTIPVYAYAKAEERIKQKKYGFFGDCRFNFNYIEIETGGGFGKFDFIHHGQKIEDLLYGTELFDYSLDVDTADNYQCVYSSQRFYTLRPLVCEIGERIDWLPIIEEPIFSPRIRLIYDSKPTLYLGYGHQHQMPPLEYELKEPNTSYAKCISFGIEHLLKPSLNGKIEIYNKKYSNLVTLHYTEILGKYFETDGTGFASGVEISLKKYQTGDNFGWLSYAYVVSKRTSPYDSILTEIFAHRPHIFNFVFGKSFKKGIEIGIKFMLASGPAYDEVIGRKWNGEKWVPVYAPEKMQLPTYQRFDVHLQKKFSFLGTTGELYIIILNFLNHRNAQGYLYNSDYTMRKAFYMMPRVPFIGIKLKF